MLVPGLRILLLVMAIASPCGAQATLYIFLASLDASQEVQTPAVASTGVGTATLAFDDATNSFDLTLAGLGLSSPIQAAHFHQAPPGVNGPIVKDLGAPGSFAQTGGYAFNALYLNAAAGGLLLTDLLAGNIYVNVHTTMYPAGEIRGQLGQLIPVPEPQTWLLMVVGLIVLAHSAMRRRLR